MAAADAATEQKKRRRLSGDIASCIAPNWKVEGGVGSDGLLGRTQLGWGDSLCRLIVYAGTLPECHFKQRFFLS